MPDDEFLRYVEKQLHLIASDCFDLRAKERLRELQQATARRLAAPPIILSKEADRDPANGQ
jgi:hypothetical protein